MVSKKNFITLLFLMTFSLLSAQTYTFKMTRFGAVAKEGKSIPLTDKSSTITIRTDSRATGVIVTIDGKDMFTSTATWSLGQEGDLVVKSNNGAHTFTISPAKQAFNLEDKNAILVFSHPSNPTSFQSDIKSLKNLLTANGRLPGAKASSSTGSAARNKYAGINLPLASMLEAPFGYKPQNSFYDYDVFVKSAKKVYGWDIENSQNVTGFQWDKLDGMKCFGYPVWRISADRYRHELNMGSIHIYVCAPSADRNILEKKCRDFLIKNGYKVNENDQWVKGLVVLKYNISNANKFPGKVFLEIETYMVADKKALYEITHPEGYGFLPGKFLHPGQLPGLTVY